MSAFIDLAGKKFGLWSVISCAGTKEGSKRIRWNCVCACGTEATVIGENMRYNISKSCGCSHQTKAFKENARRKSTRHAGKGTLTYRTWISMRSRCLNSNDDHWKDYGGRGITVCVTWNDFVTFLHDMGERPKGHSLERLDNNAGYSAENCTWADPETQARNRRNTQFITICGKRKSIAEALDEYGIKTDRVWRLQKRANISRTEAFFDILEQKLLHPRRPMALSELW